MFNPNMVVSVASPCQQGATGARAERHVPVALMPARVVYLSDAAAVEDCGIRAGREGG